MQTISLSTFKPIDTRQQAFDAILGVYQRMGYSQQLTQSEFSDRNIANWMFANVSHNDREVVIGVSNTGKISLSRELLEPLRRTLDSDWMTTDRHIQAHLISYLGKP